MSPLFDKASRRVPRIPLLGAFLVITICLAAWLGYKAVAAAGSHRQSLGRYEAGSVSALDLMQSLRREVDTAGNFLDAYIGWREALQRIQEMTYYDWERDALLLESFGISFDESEER